MTLCKQSKFCPRKIFSIQQSLSPGFPPKSFPYETFNVQFVIHWQDCIPQYIKLVSMMRTEIHGTACTPKKHLKRFVNVSVANHSGGVFVSSNLISKIEHI